MASEAGHPAQVRCRVESAFVSEVFILGAGAYFGGQVKTRRSLVAIFRYTGRQRLLCEVTSGDIGCARPCTSFGES